ncbi:hypothetical protein [Granulicella mallensis]|uniref:Uncharacterized protein n=1 Tax=Granulicella mallensis TaxID=940614 RepID=A0A7W7ZU49_9BACT|nr:hypothetical protein [Granulicella mallensis]MBB5066173.1 hypothetical protein [Granulicella mallensis]
MNDTTNTNNTDNFDFFAPVDASIAAQFFKAGRNTASAERMRALTLFDTLAPGKTFKYPIEAGKTAEKTKTALANFLKSKEKPAKVILSNNPKALYVWIQRTA